MTYPKTKKIIGQNFKKLARYVPVFNLFTCSVIVAALVIFIILLGIQALATNGFWFFGCNKFYLLFFYTRRFATKKLGRVIWDEENFRSYRLTGKTLTHALQKDR